MLDTLAITGDISGNQLFKGMWRRSHEVKQGKKITAALQKDACCPRRCADDLGGRGVR
jgi:hypothetical protein